MYAKCVNVSQINVLLYKGGQELLKVKLPATAGREIWTQSYCCQQRDNNNNNHRDNNKYKQQQFRVKKTATEQTIRKYKQKQQIEGNCNHRANKKYKQQQYMYGETPSTSRQYKNVNNNKTDRRQQQS